MINNLFKYFSRILVGIVLLALLSADGLAQSFTSPISWHHTVYEARVSALGQSTAALHNNTSYHMNPAIPLESGVLSASSFLFSTTAFQSPAVSDGANLYSPSVGFSHGKFSYSAIIDFTSFSIPPIDSESGNLDISNRLLRFQTGYRFNENFSAGIGFLYSSYQSTEFSFNNETYGGDASAWGITAGAHYQNQFESNNFLYLPQIGLALNDLSNGFDFESSDMNETNLPGQIRLGLGLDISSKNFRHNRPLFGGGIYTGFSKYLARWETEDESSITSPSGFEALFTTWNSFERFDGTEMVEISLSEQISTSIGFELHFLETLYLRYGIIGGSDYWIRPQNGLGAEIDLYYISLAVTHLNYHSSERWGPQDSSTYVQASFRIPIDGQPRDTLLGRLFN